MTRLLSYSFVAILAAVSCAAPNPAVNRIDAPLHIPQSTIISSKTASSLSITPRVTLKPREPAVNRIDAVGVNVHHKPTSSAIYSHSFRTLVSTTLGPHITLNPRDPAVNRIDAVGVKANHKTTTHSRTTKSTVSSINASARPYITLNPRDPAVNRIDAVGNGMADEVLASVSGGTPVTLAISDIEQLEAAATDITAAPAVPMPLVSVIPSPPNPAVPASFFAPPPPSSTAIPVPVPNTQTVLYLTLRPSEPIPKLDMGQTLLHAIAALRDTIEHNDGQDEWLPTDDWSWSGQGWDCLLTADRNTILAPGGRVQRLTYGILHSALVGLWGEMYDKGRYFACEFEIQDARWGVVGSGRMSPWRSLS